MDDTFRRDDDISEHRSLTCPDQDAWNNIDTIDIQFDGHDEDEDFEEGFEEEDYGDDDDDEFDVIEDDDFDEDAAFVNGD